MKKIITYGVRNYELPTFEKLAKQYDVEFIYRDIYLSNDCKEDAYGYEYVMVRGNCFLNEDSLKALQEHGLKVLLTRTAGYNHIDIAACSKLGIPVAYVPAYSPYSVAELTTILGMSLLRNLPYTLDRTSKKNFVVTDNMFSREIRECTVGILGCGKIGRTTGKLFRGLGAKVIGFDAYPNKEAEQYLTYVSIDEFAKNSDIICCHLPYIKGETDNFINADFVSKMKEHSILINSARGEVMDFDAVLDAVEDGKIDGLALDVVKDEKALFFKDHSQDEITNPTHERILKLYPKVIVTPHIGSATTLALQDMIEISLQNLDEILKNESCKNSLNK